MFTLLLIITLIPSVLPYWLMASNNILTMQRLDPILSPGSVSSHVHSVVGGSNFSINLTTTEELQQSECTSLPLQEDKSNYWFPHLYFQKNDGSFVSVSGNVVIDNSSVTTPFPDDFRMISGDATLRTLNSSSFAQQAISFKCLQFKGTSRTYDELPVNEDCPAGIRSQINFPSCWDGVNTDSEDHKSHVAFPSTGPDNGTCKDPLFPITVPRIFMEVYWITGTFTDMRQDAMTPSQPFVFANGDPTGYGYHADFFNGWESGVLQKAINLCNCNPYGDPTCCVEKQAFTMDGSKKCYISETVDEQVHGDLSLLPGANPVQAPCYESYIANYTPALLDPVYVSAQSPNKTGDIVVAASTTNVSQAAQATCIRQGAGERLRLQWTFSFVILGLLYQLSDVLYFGM